MHLLTCLVSIKRRGLAEAFLRDYPRESMESIYALEESLMWLAKELLIGPDPNNPDKIFLTRKAHLRLKNHQDSHLPSIDLAPFLVLK